MPQFITLMRMTGKGRNEIAKSLDRGEAIQEALAELGVTRLDYFITLGAYDCIMLFDAPDETVMAHALMEIGTYGAVETNTLTVITKDDFTRILEALAEKAPT